MREKITSALFIILANLVLMVHAIVPHHHHNNNLCFDLLEEELHLVHDKFESKEDNHEHDQEKENENDRCFLLDIVALSSIDIKQNFRIATNYGGLYNDFSIVAILNQGNGIIDNPYFSLQNLPQRHNSKYLSLASGALGLRAPPQVS